MAGEWEDSLLARGHLAYCGAPEDAGLTMKHPAHNSLLVKQGGTCALCPAVAGLTLDIDGEGRPRGLLCPSCHIVVGYYQGFLIKWDQLQKIDDYLAGTPTLARSVEAISRPSVALRKARILKVWGEVHREQPQLGFAELVGRVAILTATSPSTVRRLIKLNRGLKRGYTPKG